MSNYHLAPADKPQALTPQALRSLRQDPVQGISRRTLLRRSIGGAALLWITEVTFDPSLLWRTEGRRPAATNSESGDRPTSGPNTSIQSPTFTATTKGRRTSCWSIPPPGVRPGEDTEGDGPR